MTVKTKLLPFCDYHDVGQPIVQVFSLLAIATSYIGFVLGLADFLADCEWVSRFLLLLA